ncbi:MAG: hypothetical protein ABJA75_09165 [Bradyrhizobium sp.]
MKYLAAAVLLLACSSALAEDMTPKVAAHLLPANAEIKISRTRTALEEGRSVQVACGVITVRKDAGNYSTRTFAYVVDDDQLWLNGMEEWLKEPQQMGVVRVMKYCPGN